MTIVIPNHLFQDFKTAFGKQKQKAGKRGVAWQLTFEEWAEFWLACDRYKWRGRRRNQLCMARFHDTGPYAVTNIWAATNYENARLSTGGKPGRKWTPAYHLRMQGKFDGKPKAIRCPAGDFESIKEAADAMGISRSLVSRRAGCPNRLDYIFI